MKRSFRQNGDQCKCICLMQCAVLEIPIQVHVQALWLAVVTFNTGVNRNKDPESFPDSKVKRAP